MIVTSEKVYAMLGNSALWKVAVQSHEVLGQAGIAHTICDGVAVCLHGYQRNTTDIDLIVKAEDSDSIKELLGGLGYKWNDQEKEFSSPEGIVLQFLMAGTKAGKDSEVTVPEPSGDSNIELREGVSVVRLSRLIEMKIACGTGSLRRTHKDFADVVELIARRQLDSTFAKYLHRSVRKTFKQLSRQAQAEE